jgi:hypothetical protein
MLESKVPSSESNHVVLQIGKIGGKKEGIIKIKPGKKQTQLKL